jgi:hypothetical protein
LNASKQWEAGIHDNTKEAKKLRNTQAKKAVSFEGIPSFAIEQQA